ncbi:MAG: 4Fe-4S dicluster domain-containing protein [Rhodothermaceae bacterium]
MSLTDKIFEAGVVGAGGGGFPTHVKAGSEVEYILANGAECEPLIHKDYELMVNYSEEVLDGMKLMMNNTGATKGVVGIKKKNAGAVNAIKETNSNPQIDILEMGDFYPAGDEYELVQIATGRLIPPGGIPLNVGCVVNNVETFYNVSNAQKGIPVTQKFLSVTGLVKEPKSFWAPVGTSYKDLIEFVGGTTIDDYAILISGILMGGFTYDVNEVVTKTCAGIIIIPKDHYLVSRKDRSYENMNRIGKSACDQCSACTEFCPRYLMGYDIQPHKVMRSLEFTTSGEDYWNQFATYCCSCGLCTLYSCPEGLFPREACDQANQSMKEKGIQYKQTREPKLHSMKEYRRVPIKLLLKRLRIDKYEQPTPMVDDSPNPVKVKIPLKQHIGAPTNAIVSLGDSVRTGDVIGKVPEGSLGAQVHASIGGRVTEVTSEFITIEKN